MQHDGFSELARWLDYNPIDGSFIWAGHPKDVTRVGTRADVINHQGGRQIWFKGVSYNPAKLAWLKSFGEFPTQKLFYLDGDPSNIRLGNLQQRGAFDRSRHKKKKTIVCNNPRAKSNAYFKQRYGITLAAYETMFEKQDGVCAICHKPETVVFRGSVRNLCVDHDHMTGKIRSLLCHACNVGLGNFRDDPTLLEAGAAYLRRHAEPANVVPLLKEFRR